MPTNAGAVPIKQRGIIFNHEVTEMDFNNLFKETHNVEAPENAYEHFCDVFCAEEENMKEFVVSKVADIIAEMDTDKADYAREWETVFDEPHTFGIYVGDQPDLKPLKNLTFYRTYGGGPEGGYVVSKEDLVWEVERNWMKPFAIMKFKCVMRLSANLDFPKKPPPQNREPENREPKKRKNGRVPLLRAGGKPAVPGLRPLHEGAQPLLPPLLFQEVAHDLRGGEGKTQGQQGQEERCVAHQAEPHSRSFQE